MKENKIKILCLYFGLIEAKRGTPFRVKNFIKYLSAYGNLDINIISCDQKTSLNVPHTQIHNRKILFYNLKNTLKIINYVKKNKIDIVVGHTIVSWLYLLGVKFFTKSKVVLEMHGFVAEEKIYFINLEKSNIFKELKKIFYLLQKQFHNLSYKKMDLITTCSQTATDNILKYNKNTVTIFGAADLDIFNPNVASGKMFKKEGVIIGYAGNLRIYQGVKFLTDSFRELVAEYPQFKLKLLTDDGAWPIEKNDNTEIINRVEHEEVPKFLIDCDILIIPREDNIVNKLSFPSKLPEYMAMGKAVVTSKTSDADKIIKHGFNGLLFEPSDKEGVKQCLISLLDENYRNKIGQNAFLTIKNNLTWKIQIEKIYKEILKLI